LGMVDHPQTKKGAARFIIRDPPARVKSLRNDTIGI
jgi:hypothetical protein